MTDEKIPPAPRSAPPKGKPFAKGKSGNPRGRPKGSRNLSGLLKAALDEKGEEMSKLEAAVRQIADNAAAGDPRILQMLLAELRRREPAAAEPHDCPAAIRTQMEGAHEELLKKLWRLREGMLQNEQETWAKGICPTCGQAAERPLRSVADTRVE
jgi:hypothetical protein